MANSSVYQTILESAQSTIVGLGLAGISYGNIVLLKVLTSLDRDLKSVPVKYPAIILAPFGSVEMDPSAGTNLRDDKIYPVVAVIVAADQQDQSRNSDRYFSWIEQIRDAFHNKRLNGAVTVYAGATTPLATVDAQTWIANSLFVAGLLLKFRSREARPT